MAPAISIIGKSGMGNLSHQGTPGALKICFQYALFPLKEVIKKVNSANTAVTPMLPVTLAPPGKKGISPIILAKKIKKKIVSRNGTS